MKKKILLAFTLIMISITTLCTVNVSAETIVNVFTVSDFQSAHNYAGNMDKTWIYTHPTEADSLKITFSSDTATESAYDWIYILDGNNNQIEKQSGTALAGKTVTIPGNVVKIRLTSDSGVQRYGFRVTSVDAIVYGPITDFVGAVVSETSIRFTFSPPTEAASVILEYSTDETIWSAAPTTKILTSESTWATVTGLEFGVKYYFRLNVDGGKRKGLSNVLTQTSGYTSEDDFEFSNGTITSYSGNASYVAIPERINGVSVTAIGSSAFRDCTSLRKITIPEGVTSIGDYAFYNCTALTHINWNAKNVADFSVTNYDYSNRLSRGNYVFYNAGQSGAGINVVFGDSVERIPAYCFYPYHDSGYSPRIESVTIGSNVAEIGNYAFYDCRELRQINWNAKNVADFSSHSNFVFAYAGAESRGNGINVVFGDSVKRIPAYCFYTYDYYYEYTPKITSVTIGNKVTSIGYLAFGECSDLVSVNISDLSTWCEISFDSISSNPLYYAHNLYLNGNFITELVIPDGVTRIGSYAFYTYDAITSVTIPDSVTSIDRSAFGYCSSLTTVRYKGSEEQWKSIFIDVYNECLTDTDITFGYTDMVYGDINGSGATDVSDVIKILQLIASNDFSGIAETQKTSADVNVDGNVDVSDVIRILQYIANPSISLNPNK